MPKEAQKTEEKVTFEADKDNAGKRLDVFLSEQKSYGTRAYFKRIIGKGAVKINGEYAEKSSYKVKMGDKIETVLIKDDFIEELVPEDIKLDIEYEDENFLFINKPSGMVVHPGAGNPSGTLANAVLGYLNKQVVKDKEAELSRKVGLAHRLDKDTSGGILVVKDEEILGKVMSLFAAREVEKYYVAICYKEGTKLINGINQGVEFESEKFFESLKDIVSHIDKIKLKTISNQISRHLGDRRKMMISPEKGRGSVTEYSILGEVSLVPMYQAKLEKAGIGKLYIVLLKPVTGRLHQLRVHMKSIGMPILGDPMYGKGFEIVKKMFLHSFWLGFDLDLGKKTQKAAKTRHIFNAMVSRDWEQVFDKYDLDINKD